MPRLLEDLRYGLRISLRNPGYTLVAVFTLALGIAANTTIFSWVEMMLWRPIPGASRASELAMFETVAADGGALPTSYRDFRDYRDHLRLARLAAILPNTLNAGPGDHTERLWGELVSGNYFEVVGVRPALGRFFSREEYGDQPGAHPVAILGYRLWKRKFNGDAAAIGSTILLNHQPLTIIGVAPPEFHGSLPGLFLELWAPITMAPQLNSTWATVLDDRNARMLMTVARLGPGVTIERARAEASSLARRLAETDSRTNGGLGATVLPIRKSHFGGQTMMEGPLMVLMAACGVVFLIVCANVANLLLARATTRRKEFSLRLVMGASRGRLVRHLLAESLILALLGALAGVPLAMWMSQSLGYLMPRGANLPVSFDIPLNADILGFTLLLCAVACLAAGLVPALHGARANLTDALNEGGRGGSAGARSARLRSLLVASEVAMAVFAIIGAGLFVRSFQVASRMDPGFDARGVLAATIDLSQAGYSPAERRDFCDRLQGRLASQPGIVKASWAEVVPLWFIAGPVENVEVEGYLPGRNESMKLARNTVAPGYFDLVRMPLVEGRDFDSHDRESSRRVLIVNQTFAARFLAGREPVGRRVRVRDEWHTIVGVARDAKYVKVTENAQPFFYLPLRQAFDGFIVSVHLRTAAAPEQAIPMLRREVAAAGRGIALIDPMPMTEYVGASLFGHKMAAVLLAVLGVFALALAATGLYSVMAYSVAQRTQEIGIRMAIGARPADVLSLVVRQGMVLTSVGVGLGILLAVAVSRLLASLLVGVSATDPAVFLGAALFVSAIALAANYLPARRATRIDPNEALRCQ